MKDRLALLYSDGSITILSEKYNLEMAREERGEGDLNENDPKHLTKIGRVVALDIQVIDDPTTQQRVAPDTCPTCGHRKQR